jgi:predicted nucleic acid-binding protein
MSLAPSVHPGWLRDNFTVDDAAYLVLADALQVPLLTADEKLAEAGRLGIDVRMVEPR